MAVVPELTAAQREDKFWEGAVSLGTQEAFEAYLKQYSFGQYAGLAKANLLRLGAISSAASVSKNVNPADPDPKLDAPVSSANRIEAEPEEKFWDDAKAIGNKEAYLGYLENYPNGKYQSLAKANLVRLTAIESKKPAQAVNALESKPVGSTFRDCDRCPEMVVLPRGRFVMGSPVTEVGRGKDEGPQRTVEVDYVFPPPPN